MATRLSKFKNPLCCRGNVDAQALNKCHALGMTLAAGIAMGIF